MTDPVQTTQQTSDAVTATGALGLVGVILGAITALWRTIFGSKAERADALERAADIALRNAEHADERAERADEETANHRLALGTCEEQLRVMRAEIRIMRADLDALRAENANLRREQEIARGMLADLMRNASTPPHGLYTPDDVRAEMARLEETGP